jgi:hypothetical protein
MSDTHEFTDTDVYAVYEHRPESDEGLVAVFEDDADTLQSFIEYANRLETSDSTILTGRFHAASPGEQLLSRGDWYLTKRHGVGISHGLLDEVTEQ